MDVDRCGYGTPWGCGGDLPETGPVKVVLNAVKPINAVDNGHRMFHPECFEAVAPMTQPASRRLVPYGA